MYSMWASCPLYFLCLTIPLILRKGLQIPTSALSISVILGSNNALFLVIECYVLIHIAWYVRWVRKKLNGVLFVTFVFYFSLSSESFLGHIIYVLILCNVFDSSWAICTTDRLVNWTVPGRIHGCNEVHVTYLPCSISTRFNYSKS